MRAALAGWIRPHAGFVVGVFRKAAARRAPQPFYDTERFAPQQYGATKRLDRRTAPRFMAEQTDIPRAVLFVLGAWLMSGCVRRSLPHDCCDVCVCVK